MDFTVDMAAVDIACPRCDFYNSTTIRQARTRDVVICRGCKGNIQLEDHMNEVRTAERMVRASIRALSETLSRTMKIEFSL